LIESDQAILAFLDEAELKLLFTMLIGVFSASAVLIYDLSEPFIGQYQIRPTIGQLRIIRDTLPVGLDDSPEPTVTTKPMPQPRWLSTATYFESLSQSRAKGSAPIDG